jgi:hypothetical protein
MNTTRSNTTEKSDIIIEGFIIDGRNCGGSPIKLTSNTAGPGAHHIRLKHLETRYGGGLNQCVGECDSCGAGIQFGSGLPTNSTFFEAINIRVHSDL